MATCARIEAFRDVIFQAIEAQKDITLVDLAAMLDREHGAVLAPSTVHRFLVRHRITLKKKSAHASELAETRSVCRWERPDVARRRQAWFDGQPSETAKRFARDLDPERLIFVDESGANTKMARLRGRSPRGERCQAAVPHGHWKTTTFVGALRLGGMTAPMVLDGPMTGPAFPAQTLRVSPRLCRAGAGAHADQGRHRDHGPAQIAARFR